MAYKIYISDTLYHQAQNQRLNVRYLDLLDTKPKDNRTSDEIILDVMKTAGLRFKE